MFDFISFYYVFVCFGLRIFFFFYDLWVICWFFGRKKVFSELDFFFYIIGVLWFGVGAVFFGVGDEFVKGVGFG